MNQKKRSRVKVISLGSVNVGKSCLIKRYCEKRFVAKYVPTVGVDFGVTSVVTDEWRLKVNLFDLSGHNLYKEVRNEFYKDTQAVLLVYDVTSKISFEALDSWMDELKEYIKNSTDFNQIVFILCANKTDKKNGRLIDFSKGHDWAQKHNCHYFETSAQNGEGISDAFQVLFSGLVQILEKGYPLKPANNNTVSGYTVEQMAAIEKLKSSKDNYSRLGLSYGAGKDDVNRNYRKLAKLLHPDKCKMPESIEAFKILVSAKDALLKEVK